MQPKIYHASDHDIDPALIDIDAIYILKKLKEAGFLAYLVGGSVRDLLVKRVPKDFDISTSARPEQIKQVFQRNCLLIGRRFRLAHIRFGHKIFEVSTFRAGDNESDLILQDNIWGSPEEDVLRRDFTINGLFYDPFSHTVIDYVGGWDDIHKHTLRTIGEASMRFRQDPVRMIRLLKFQARFGFEVDPLTHQALNRCIQEIVKSSPARILEEMLRMLESSASEPFFRLMTSTGLLELLFPCLEHFLKGKYGEDTYQLLSAADAINAQSGKKTLDRAILTSCLLFPILEREIQAVSHHEKRTPHFGDIIMITNSVIKGVMISSFSNFPKKLSAEAAFIMSTQYRLTPLDNKRNQRSRMLQNREFDFALRFLKVRAHANDELTEAYNWWCHQKQVSEHQMERHGHHHHPAPRHKDGAHAHKGPQDGPS